MSVDDSAGGLPGMWEAADLSGGCVDAENERSVTEPGFYPEWYTLGIRSRDVTDDGDDIGNRAYMDWIERVILSTGRSKVDWTQVSLAVILDREVRADEARRTS